jgi:hypothetical protein
VDNLTPDQGLRQSGEWGSIGDAASIMIAKKSADLSRGR